VGLFGLKHGGKQLSPKLTNFKMFGRNTQAVRHHVLAKIDPNKWVSLGKAARQPMAGPVCQPAAFDITSCRPANRASQRLASGFPQTFHLLGVYFGLQWCLACMPSTKG